MAEILKFTGITCIDEAPEDALEKAKAWGMTDCVILGLDDAGKLCFGGSTSDAGKIMLMLEAAKLEIIKNTLE